MAKKYTIFATVTQKRTYQVEGEDALAAQENLREDWSMMEYDVIDEDMDDVEVAE